MVFIYYQISNDLLSNMIDGVVELFFSAMKHFTYFNLIFEITSQIIKLL